MLSFPEAAAALGAGLHFLNPAWHILGASIDTRTLERGNLFVALKGTKMDGHLFLSEAFSRGASGALVEENYFKEHSRDLQKFHNLLVVSDSGAALARLAGFYRTRFNIPMVGITGSVGKTSTKEFLRYILSQKWNILATRGNLNNHLGLPLTLLGLQESHQACVAELGANHKGEIRELAALLKPDHAMITCVAPVHLSGFGSLQNIYEAKLELFDSLRPGATAVIPDDDAVLLARSRPETLNVLRVGFSAAADYRVSDVKVLNSFVRFRFKGREFSFPGEARFLARNAAMALAMAETLGIPLSEIPETWTDFLLPSGRFQPRLLENGVTIIDDGYNASPVSFKAALEVFSEWETTGRRVLVFADMLELGDDEIRYHEELGERIAGAGLDMVLAYGPLAARAVSKMRGVNSSLQTFHFENARDTANFLKSRLQKGDVLLLKASRGMRIEEVVPVLI